MLGGELPVQISGIAANVEETDNSTLSRTGGATGNLFANMEGGQLAKEWMLASSAVGLMCDTDSCDTSYGCSVEDIATLIKICRVFCGAAKQRQMVGTVRWLGTWCVHRSGRWFWYPRPQMAKCGPTVTLAMVVESGLGEALGKRST